MNCYKIVVIPGDGIGHEIIRAGKEVLRAVSEKEPFQLDFTDYSYGAGYYRQTGRFMPDNGIADLCRFDAIFFGGIGLPEVDDSLPAKEFTFKVRNNLRQYVNHRPARSFPGVAGPLRSTKKFDFVIVRENNEGEFTQVGGQYMPHFENGLGIDLSIFSRKGIERIAHYAFQLAGKRGDKNLVTAVTKSNTLIHSLTYWDRVIREVSEQYGRIKLEFMYVDACAACMVLRPERFDVVLTTNLFGDILSDLGGALMGSLGLGGSGNINPEREFPSMFEPIHGSAPDIAGKGIANPIATLWSAAMMLEHLGEISAAERITKAMDEVCLAQIFTPDLGGKETTDSLARAVIERL